MTTEEQIDTEVQRTGRNRYEVAADLAILNSDSPPAAMAAPLARLKAQREALAEADEEARAALAAEREREGRIAKAGRMASDISWGEQLLADCEADIKAIESSLEAWPQIQRSRPAGTLVAAVDQIQKSKWWIGFLPGWIERRKAELASFEAQHNIGA